MKLAMIGFGQAGGKIVDRFVEYDAKNDLGVVKEAIAINTADTDLQGLECVPEDNRVLIGADKVRVKGHGVGADNERGAEVAEADIDILLNKMNDIPVHEVDAFLIVAGLGGGTGSGGSPVLARELGRRYTEPVYGLGVLPAETEGGLYTMNAARSLKTFIDEVDALMLFDNDEWRESGESVAGGYDTINDELVKRYCLMFAAGEVGVGDGVAESVVDSSEIINTLDCGGLASVGFASDTVDLSGQGFISSMFGSDDGGTAGDDAEDVNRITSLTRQAVLGRLTFPCEIDSTKRALVVVSGPAEKLNRKGIESARRWIEDECGTMEVRGGDYPVDSDQVSVTVLLGGITDSDRITEMQEKAVKAKHNIDELRSQDSDDLSEVAKEQDDIDPLF